MSEDLIHFDLIIRSQIGIEASPSVVWGYLDRPQDWKSSLVSIERLAGSANEVGEVLRIGQRPVEETVYMIHETLRVDPSVWKVSRMATEDEGRVDGYVIYSLTQDGSQTWLVCEVVARCTSTSGALQGITIGEFAGKANEATRTKLDADHRALKRLIEKRGGD